jgi:alpha-ketoglutarate-dependent taurine dioxygenase
MDPTAELPVRVEKGATPLATAPRTEDVTASVAWLTRNRPAVLTALRRHGALVVRGLPVTDVDSFAAMRDAILTTATPYREKATPRSELGAGVLSSTDLPAALPIRMHNENSYTLTFPGLLLFGCLTAPQSGGATPVADVRRVLTLVPPAVEKRVRASGWLLERAYSEHLSLPWQTAFATDRREDVERYCDEHLISFEWQPSGALRTSQRRPGIIRHPSTGEEVWFNHLAFWSEWALDKDIREALVGEFGREGLPFRTRFGDGAELTLDDLAQLQEAYVAATVRRAWQPGDLLLVDNVLAAHGRDPYEGPRRIAVAMGEPVDLGDCRPTVPASA